MPGTILRSYKILVHNTLTNTEVKLKNIHPEYPRNEECEIHGLFLKTNGLF